MFFTIFPPFSYLTAGPRMSPSHDLPGAALDIPLSFSSSFLRDSFFHCTSQQTVFFLRNSGVTVGSFISRTYYLVKLNITWSCLFSDFFFNCLLCFLIDIHFFHFRCTAFGTFIFCFSLWLWLYSPSRSFLSFPVSCRRCNNDTAVRASDSSISEL